MPDPSPALWTALALAGLGLAFAAGRAFVRARGSSAAARDWIALTKPRVISLLLVTAVAPMYVSCWMCYLTIPSARPAMPPPVPT